jgi:hypothetical protein
MTNETNEGSRGNTYEQPERFDEAEGRWAAYHAAQIGDLAALLEGGLPPWQAQPAQLADSVAQ